MSLALATSGTGVAHLSSAQQPFCRRRFAVTLRPRLKTELQRRRECRAIQSFDQPLAPVPRRRSPDGAKLMDLPLSHPESKASNGAAKVPKFFMEGAAAAAMAAGMKLGSKVANAVESMPVVAHLEMLMGTAVTARNILSQLGDRKSRAKVDRKLNSLLDTLNAAFATPALAAEKTKPALIGPEGGDHGEGGQGGAEEEEEKEEESKQGSASAATVSASAPSALSEPTNMGGSSALVGPTMLEVELRSIVDKSCAAAKDFPPGTAITIDRPTLIGSMAELIRTREKESHALQEKLQRVVEASRAVSQSLQQADKIRDMREAKSLVKDRATSDAVQKSLLEAPARRTRRRTSDTASTLMKLQLVQEVHQSMQSERKEVLKEVAGLQQDLGILSLNAKKIAATKQGTPTLSPSLSGREEVSPSQSQAVELKLEGLKAMHRAHSSGTLLDKIFPGREVSVLQQRLGALEGQLKTVTDSRDQLLVTNAELHQRVTEASLEKQQLTDRLSNMETSLAQARPRTAATSLSRDTSLGGLLSSTGSSSSSGSTRGTRAEGPWSAQAALESELRGAVESRKKYEGAVKWLGMQLQTLSDSDSNDKETQIRSSLEFAHKRAKEESARVFEIQARLERMELEAHQQQSQLHKRVFELGAKINLGFSIPSGVTPNSIMPPNSTDPGTSTSSSGSSSSNSSGGRSGSRDSSSRGSSGSGRTAVLSPMRVSSPAFAVMTAPVALLAPTAAPAPTPALTLTPTAALTLTPTPALAHAVPVSTVSTVSTAAALLGRVGAEGASAAAVAAAWLKEVSAKVKEDEDQQQRQAKKAALIPPMNERQLRTFAGAIFPAYVAASDSEEVQARGMESLIKDLVKNGAEEEWARDLVTKELATASGAMQTATD